VFVTPFWISVLFAKAGLQFVKLKWITVGRGVILGLFGWINQ
jgi:hypothetical protein